MQPNQIFWLVGGVIVVALAIVILLAVKKVRDFSRQLFGTPSVSEGIARQREMLSRTPKSVSAMTRVYLPQIERDFPAFHYDEARQKAEDALSAFFTALTRQDASRLASVSQPLRQQAVRRIDDAKARGEREHFERVRIHQTEIARYIKSGGRCTVVFQSAVEYLFYVTRQNELLRGSKELFEQTKYNISLVYVQDAKQLTEAEQDKSAGLTCPNCGAPLKTLGVKICDYCGSSVEEINRYAWEFSGIELID